MFILLVGDTHGSFIPLINMYIKEYKEKYSIEINSAIQVGDFGVYPSVKEWIRLKHGYEKLLVPTYFIKGNHEDEKELRRLESGHIKIENLHYITDGSFFTLDGISIFAHGGGFTPLTAVQRGVIPWSERDCDISVQKWKEYGRPIIDLLITHDAPNGVGPIGESEFGNPWTAGSKGIRDLWQTIHPKQLICGHYHKYYHYFEGDLEMTILDTADKMAAILNTETNKIHPMPPLDRGSIVDDCSD